MLERFTEQAKKALFYARYEATHLGASVLDSRHLLLGILSENSQVLQTFFNQMEISSQNLREDCIAHVTPADFYNKSGELLIGHEMKIVLEKYAPEEAERMGSNKIGIEHLFLGVLRHPQSIGYKLLEGRGLNLFRTREGLATILRKPTNERRKEGKSILDEFTLDLTARAKTGRLDPLIGREIELDRLLQILCRRQKNNPVLLGEPGVGKTAIVEGLAQKIIDDNIPSVLSGRRLLSLDLSLVIAGTKYRGQFEERIKTIIKEIAESRNVILFIDEIHTLIGAGSAEGSLDAANILKPSLARGEIQCIGATTFHDYKRYIEKDRALVRRFQPIRVSPPSEKETLDILHGIKHRYEEFHGVNYTEDALKASVCESARYIPDRFLPDKAIDLIDEAGAKTRLFSIPPENIQDILQENIYKISSKSDIDRPIVIDKQDILEVISKWTKIPVTHLNEGDREKLLRMEETLKTRIIGQNEAISAISRAIRRSNAGVRNPRKPIGSFIFLGPSGVGKTEVAKSLAEFLFGDKSGLIRFDMSEYMEKHAVSRIIGSPPGYVGYEEGGNLTETIKHRPYCVLLFDEIEKAHHDVLNILLQIMDEGTLTDSYGDTVDFKNTILIMTSNIGSRFLMQKGVMGFQDNMEERRSQNEEVLRGLREILLPEFIGRVDEIIVFNLLKKDNLIDIANKMIGELDESLSSAKNLHIEATQDAVEALVDKCCLRNEEGARPLLKGIQHYIEDPLAEILLKERNEKPCPLLLEFVEGELILREGEPIIS